MSTKNLLRTIALIFSLFFIEGAFAQPDLYGVSGNTMHYKLFENKLWISREFGTQKNVGLPLGTLAHYNPVTRIFNTTKYPKLAGAVVGAHEDAQGRLYIFGRFLLMDEDRGRYYSMARFLPDGSIDQSFRYDVAGAVTRTVSDGVQIYAVGSIRAITDPFGTWLMCRGNGFAIDLKTGTFTDWSPDTPGNGINCESGSLANISHLAVAQDSVYLLGKFSFLQGKARAGLAEVDKASGTMTSFSADAAIDAQYYESGFTSIALTPTMIYVSGFFDTIGGVARNGFARFNRQSGALDSYVPSFDSFAVQLTYAPPYLYSAGYRVPGLVKRVIESTGQVDTSFAYGGTSSVVHLDSTRNELISTNGTYSAGSGGFINSNPQIDTVGHYQWGEPRFTFVGPANGTLIFAGEYNLIDVKAQRPRLVELDLATGAPTNFVAPDTRDLASAFDVTSSDVFLFNFETLSRINRATGAEESLFRVERENSQLPVIHQVRANGNVVTLAGQFSRCILGGQTYPRAKLASYNFSTNTFLPLSISLDGEIKDFRQDGSTLYIIGTFTTVNGVSRKHFAALDANTGAVLPFYPTINSTELNAILLDFGILYLGGKFTIANGLSRKNVAAFDTETGNVLPLSVTSHSMTANNPDAKVVSLAINGFTLFVGVAYADSYQPWVIAVNAESGTEIPFNAFMPWGIIETPQFLAVASSTINGPKDRLLFGGAGWGLGYYRVYGNGQLGIHSAAPSMGVVLTSTTPLPTPTKRPTSTPIPTNTPGPTRTPWPTPTFLETATPTESPTPMVTTTNSPTASPTASSTSTIFPTVTPSPVPYETSTALPTVTATTVPEFIGTESPTSTPTSLALIKFSKARYKRIKGRRALVFPVIPKNHTIFASIIREGTKKTKRKTLSRRNWYITLQSGTWFVSFEVRSSSGILVGRGTKTTVRVKKHVLMRH